MNSDPNFEEWLVTRGITLEIFRDRLENYSETTVNK
jgi:hypothetical protein